MENPEFHIAETVGTCEARLEILSFTKRKDQLREEVEGTRITANVGVNG